MVLNKSQIKIVSLYTASEFEFHINNSYTNYILSFKQVHGCMSRSGTTLRTDWILLVPKSKYSVITRQIVWMDNHVADVTQSFDELFDKK